MCGSAWEWMGVQGGHGSAWGLREYMGIRESAMSAVELVGVQGVHGSMQVALE